MPICQEKVTRTGNNLSFYQKYPQEHRELQQNPQWFSTVIDSFFPLLVLSYPSVGVSFRFRKKWQNKEKRAGPAANSLPTLGNQPTTPGPLDWYYSGKLEFSGRNRSLSRRSAYRVYTHIECKASIDYEVNIDHTGIDIFPRGKSILPAASIFSNDILRMISLNLKLSIC